MRWAALVLAGCAPRAMDSASGPELGPKPGTSCTVDPEHPLVASCHVVLEQPGPAELRFVSSDGRGLRFASDADATDHWITAWGLGADTDWDWMMGAESGSIRTGALPDDLAGLDVEVSGEIFGFDAVLQVVQCAGTWLAMFDDRGRVLWYEPTAVYQNATNGYDWSQAERSVMIQSPRTFQQVHVSGEIALELLGGVDFEGALHHDNTRWGPYTYTLFDERVGELAVDGFYVWRGSEQVGRFFLGDHYDIPATGTGDWSHANGLNATPDGVLALSLRNFDRVLAIDGDPDSPRFLEILWTAEGTGAGPADYLAPAGIDEGWSGQHNPTLDGDRLWLFDNAGDGTRSRAARYVLDVGSGEARIERSWWLDEDCPIQSGAIPVEGGVLVSCATSARISLFREAAEVPSFELHARCPIPGVQAAITRGIPVVIE